jgi:hypothetical protein
MNRAIPLLPLCAFMAWTCKTLPFHLFVALTVHVVICHWSKEVLSAEALYAGPKAELVCWGEKKILLAIPGIEY